MSGPNWPRGSTNTNTRGSAASRRARKQWLLGTFGDGVRALCSFGCGTYVTFETMQVDCHPIPRVFGGRYVRGNIRPACAPCNIAHGIELREAIKRGGVVAP